MTQPPATNLPLILKTAKKPFLPGRQYVAIYEDHMVIAIVRGRLEGPVELHASKGADAWRKLPRARRISIIPLAEVDWIKSYEHGTSRSNTIQLTFSRGNSKFSVELPPEQGAIALAYLADKYGDKLDAKAESAIDARRKQLHSIIIICLIVNSWLAWSVWSLWRMGSITGPKVLVRPIYSFYETYGLTTTAIASAIGAACFNVILFACLLIRLPVEPRTLNCTHCGYRLQGLSGSQCPECGTPIKRSIDVDENKRDQSVDA